MSQWHTTTNEIIITNSLLAFTTIVIAISLWAHCRGIVGRGRARASNGIDVRLNWIIPGNLLRTHETFNFTCEHLRRGRCVNIYLNAKQSMFESRYARCTKHTSIPAMLRRWGTNAVEVSQNGIYFLFMSKLRDTLNQFCTWNWTRKCVCGPVCVWCAHLAKWQLILCNLFGRWAWVCGFRGCALVMCELWR